MTENALDLFYRHSFIYCHSGESTTKFVRMNFVKSNTIAYCPETDFNAADCQSVIRIGQRDEKSRVCICPAVKILLQVNLGSGIEIDFALLVAFSEDYTLTFVEVQVVAVHSDEFSDSHSGGGEQVYEGKVPNFCAVVAELFELLVSYYLFHQSVGAHFVDSAYRAFEYEVFIFKPGEETGKDPANVVNGDFA